MKINIFLLVILFGLTNHYVAQTIPNSGFENWAIAGGGWFEYPVNWQINNNQVSMPVVKNNNPHQGNFAVQVGNNFAIGYAKSKFPFSQHPTDIQIYVKSNILSSDTVKITIFVYSGGAIVDSGIWTNTTSITNWTLQTIPISQNTTAIDSLEIKIRGGNQTGTYIIVDDISYLTTGIEEKKNDISWKLYPIPTSDYTTLEFYNSTKDNFTLSLFDSNGRLVHKIIDITTDRIKIESKNLTSGFYFFQLQSDKGIATGKLVIE